jgi:predicted metal-dependent hydrolase
MIKPDEIIRSNRKTLSLSIDFFGRLIVRAPKRYSAGRIFAFIQEKESWILRKKAQMQGAGICLPPENLDGYSLLLLGKSCQITLTDEKSVRYEQATHRLFLPQTNAKFKLVKWLKENALRILSDVTQTTAERMGTSYKQVTISSAKTRWGSCTADNVIRYTFRLLYAPKEVIEYVVIHELAHTKHKNHSAYFWSEVAKYCPNWRVHRAWLKQHGALMEVL